MLATRPSRHQLGRREAVTGALRIEGLGPGGYLVGRPSRAWPPPAGVGPLGPERTDRMGFGTVWLAVHLLSSSGAPLLQADAIMLELAARDARFSERGHFVVVCEELFDHQYAQFGEFKQRIEYTWGPNGEFCSSTSFDFDEPKWFKAGRFNDYRSLTDDSLLLGQEIFRYSERSALGNRVKRQSRTVVVRRDSNEVLGPGPVIYATYDDEGQEPLWQARWARWATGRGLWSLVESVESFRFVGESLELVCRGRLSEHAQGIGYWVLVVSPSLDFLVTEARYYRRAAYGKGEPSLSMVATGELHESGLLASSTITFHMSEDLVRRYTFVAGGDGESESLRARVRDTWASPEDDPDREIQDYRVSPARFETYRDGVLRIATGG